MLLIYAFRRRYAVPAIGAVLLAAAVVWPIESVIVGPQVVHGSQRTGIHVFLMLALSMWWFVPLEAVWRRWLLRRPARLVHVDGGRRGIPRASPPQTDAEGAQAGRIDEVHLRRKETMLDRAVIASVLLLSLYHKEDITAARIVSNRGVRVTFAVLLFGLLLVWLTVSVLR